MILGSVDRLIDIDEVRCTLYLENISVVVRFAGTTRFCSTDDSELLLRARKLFNRKVSEFQVGALACKGQLPLFQ